MYKNQRGILKAVPAGKKLNVMNGCGALGASVCTLIMLLPVIIGTAGASATVACSMPGMCGYTGNPFLGSLSVLMSNNWVVQPLLIASLALIFYGMRGFGIIPLATSAIGGGLLYIGMFVLSMSVPVTIAASLTLGVSYGVAYVPSLTGGTKRHSSIGGTGAPHKIQIFSAGCKLCSDTVDIVEVGKCKDCQMEVLGVDDGKNNGLLKQYDIGAVPSIVIDGRIKVVGKPVFPWFCGDDFYKMLETRFPLRGK